MADAGTIRVKLAAVTKDFRDAMRRADDSVAKLKNRFNELGPASKASLLAVGAGATAAAYAVTRFTQRSIAQFADFEAAIDRVGAITGLETGSKQIEKMGDLALELATKSKFTGQEVASAYNFMAMAGMRANTIMEATPAVLQLAATGVMDLGDAANIVTNIMAGYGKTAEELTEVNDVLAASITGANVDVRQMGEAFKMAGPVAKAAGVSLKETAALIATMGNAGIQGTLAGTALRRAIANLLSPTKKAQKVIDSLGVSIKDSSGKMRAMGDILFDFKRAGMEAEDAMEVFGLRAGPGMLAVMEQGETAFTAFMKRLEESGGMAERIATREMETLKGQFNAMKASIEALQVTFGELFASTAGDAVKAVSTLASSIVGLIRKFQLMKQAVKDFIDDSPALWATLETLSDLSDKIKEGLANMVPGVSLGKALRDVFGFLLEDEIKIPKMELVPLVKKEAPGVTDVLKNSIKDGVKSGIEEGAKEAKPKVDFSELTVATGDFLSGMDFSAFSESGIGGFDTGVQDALSSLENFAQGAFKASKSSDLMSDKLLRAAEVTEASARMRQQLEEQAATAKKQEIAAYNATVDKVVGALAPAFGKLAGTFQALFKKDWLGAALQFGSTALSASRSAAVLSEGFNSLVEGTAAILDAFEPLIALISKLASAIGQVLKAIGEGLGSAVGWIEKNIFTMSEEAKTRTKLTAQMRKMLDATEATIRQQVNMTKLFEQGFSVRQTGQLFSSASAEAYEEFLREQLDEAKEQLALVELGGARGDRSELMEHIEKIKLALEDSGKGLETASEAITKTAAEISEELTNVPSGIKVALRRFQATQAFGSIAPIEPAMAFSGGMSSPIAPAMGFNPGRSVIVQNMNVQAQDPMAIMTEVERESAHAARAQSGSLAESTLEPGG